MSPPLGLLFWRAAMRPSIFPAAKLRICGVDDPINPDRKWKDELGAAQGDVMAKTFQCC